MLYEKKVWINAIYIICISIFLISGFVFGYFYNYKANNSCTNNPFIYGIQEMNELNQAEFSCTCDDRGLLPFSFNAEEMKGYSKRLGQGYISEDDLDLLNKSLAD